MYALKPLGTYMCVRTHVETSPPLTPTNPPNPHTRYNFNDSTVSAIDAAAVQRAWGGKWSSSSSFSYTYSGA